MAKAKKEVAVKEQALPSYIKESEGRGNENVTSDDIQLPRINVMQALSPQLDKQDPKYIAGGEVGMLFNTVTGELYPEGVNFTPVLFAKRFLVWVDRKEDAAGGLRGVFDNQVEAEQFRQGEKDRDKLEVVLTAEHLAILDDGEEVILSMAKSKNKVSKSLNSWVKLQKGDRFSRRYLLTTITEDGAKGKYQNFKIEPVKGEGAYPSEDVYKKAEALYVAISEGSQKVSGNYTDEEANNEEAEY